MTGPEHYQRAERLTRDGLAVVAAIHIANDEDRRDALGKQAMGIWAQAQVHATLALAAATALAHCHDCFDGNTAADTHEMAWYEAAGEMAVP